ncbi:MAG TPA: hypothetical protein IGS17_02620 [Oscillatoriales cyanobacterium M59_W2019_021]|nr:MAG: hypothetical protein D6728_02040 [Cyanobacteria bacterium J055]HIK30333.1 hypothetical protein [Oscillatoriales cyanobacterium M4454_W2019_049]HIK49807.1 hypothetical protein [Oscillatoriales cyanobacterium M59_W2019_021]
MIVRTEAFVGVQFRGCQSCYCFPGVININKVAIEQFSQAKELFDRSGDGDRSQDVDELLQEIITPFDR